MFYFQMVHYFGSESVLKVTVDGKLCLLLEKDCKRIVKFHEFLTADGNFQASEAPAWEKFFKFITDKEVDLSNGKDDFLKTAKYFKLDDFEDFFKIHGAAVVVFSDYETYREDINLDEPPKYSDIESLESEVRVEVFDPETTKPSIAPSGSVKITICL